MANNPAENSFHIETELSRDLGLYTALAIGVGTMIAAGIFTLSGLAVRNVGSAAVLAFLLAAIAAACTALTYCEFTSVYPESGEGYLYARKTFAPPVAYFVGWSLVLGYMSSCAFYIASLSSYFHEFIWETSFKQLSGIAALACLILLNIKGTKESGKFQVIVTLAKVVLLLWFVIGGLGSVQVPELIERFSTDIEAIGSTAAMVFITFFGFSAIAASAGEVKDPVRNIPRAIFLSMGIVTVLYTLVVVVVVAAELTEYTEAAMGSAAKQFLGSGGGFVIVGGALFSMISASNASVMAGSRVVLTMSRLRHLPEGIGVIDPRTKTPIIAVILVGGGIATFTMMLALEDLAHFADTVLLSALVLVNAALILHRRKYPNIERPFRVPLVPLIPLLGIAANLYLLVQISHHATPFVLAVCALIFGVLGYLAWKGIQPEEEAIAGEESVLVRVDQAASAGDYQILVPLMNPDNVRSLMDTAISIAKERNGHIVAVRVVQVPEQVPPSEASVATERQRRVLEMAFAFASQHDVPVTTILTVGHSVSRSILETARRHDSDLIILGWRGYTTTAKRILGEVVDEVTSHARSDVMLIKLAESGSPQKILFPTAGGEHARKAESYAASIARHLGAEITVCGVVPEEASSAQSETTEKTIQETVERIQAPNGVNVRGKLLQHNSVSVGIIKEAEDYDTVVIGAAGKSIYPQILFGSIPESVAKMAKKSVIVVKSHSPIKALVGRVMGE